jgi:metallo-beta-lactamase family protein
VPKPSTPYCSPTGTSTIVVGYRVWLPKFLRKDLLRHLPAREIAKLILLDSAKIQEEEAKANREHYSKHNNAEPLYTVAQAEKVLPLFKVIQPNEAFAIDAEIQVVFKTAGHIIGACSIELNIENKILFFSGDIGRDNDVLMFAPSKPKRRLPLSESTYGNRLHRYRRQTRA